MRISVHNTDLTPYVHAESVSFRLYDTYKMHATLTLDADGLPYTPRMGAEIVCTDDDGSRICGGIITKTEIRHNRNAPRLLKLEAQGYDHIVSRCTRSSFLGIWDHAIKTTPAEQLYNVSLLQENIGRADDSFTLEGAVAYYSFNIPTRMSTAFDLLAEASGFRWWINYDRIFYIKPEIPLNIKEIHVDPSLPDGGDGVALTEFAVLEKTADYRNIQYVIGADNVFGEAADQGEINRMAARFGKGMYPNILRNDLLTDATACTAVAEQMLKTYNDPLHITLTTQTPFRLFDRFTVTAPDYGIAADTPFACTEILLTMAGNRAVYTVTAKPTDADSVRTTGSWSNAFAQFKK